MKQQKSDIKSKENKTIKLHLITFNDSPLCKEITQDINCKFDEFFRLAQYYFTTNIALA